MQIKKIHIQNFKSLVDFELDSPKQFCAFVGPNASGKSNIFEALEFLNYFIKYNLEAPKIFGDRATILSFSPLVSHENFILGPKDSSKQIVFSLLFDNDLDINFSFGYVFDNSESLVLNTLLHNDKIQLQPDELVDIFKRKKKVQEIDFKNRIYSNELEMVVDSFSRIFVGKPELVRINSESKNLKTDASNLPQIIGQIFQNENKKIDFLDWLRILIPEFENIEVLQSNIDGRYDFFVYEKGSSKPFPRRLLSDGTKNILALMAAVYQGNEAQFLCIEEPENGLHPYAIEMLVDFFRDKCETEGHHIWLNTHSQTLVRSMKIDELVLVNKINGRTQAKRVEGMNDLDIKTDEAWLTNALGGGVLWSK